ncbi:MAG: hypothetical protein DRN57_08445, partial [Thermoplasmata archaeon]
MFKQELRGRRRYSKRVNRRQEALYRFLLWRAFRYSGAYYEELHNHSGRRYEPGDILIGEDLTGSNFLSDLDQCTTDPFDNDTDDDNLCDGVEDANQNGRIDGDNGDGIYGESETWTETSPNLQDSDGDT